jgi:hypothetical protein
MSLSFECIENPMDLINSSADDSTEGVVEEGQVRSSGWEITGKHTNKTMILLTVQPSVGKVVYKLLATENFRGFGLKDFTGMVMMQEVAVPKEVVDLTEDSIDEKEETTAAFTMKEQVASKENKEFHEEGDSKNHTSSLQLVDDSPYKLLKFYQAVSPARTPIAAAPRGPNGCFSPFSESSIEYNHVEDSEVDEDLEDDFAETQQEAFPF